MEDLLFLSHRIPYPPNKGDKIRSWHILKHLTSRYRVHLGCLYDDPEDMKHIPLLSSLCESSCFCPLDPLSAKLRSLAGFWRREPLTLGYFRDKTLRAWVVNTFQHRSPSRVFAFCSAMATYVREDRTPLRVLDMIDLDSEKWRQYAETKRQPLRALYAREHRTLLAFERQVAAEFDATLFVSHGEADQFIAQAPDLAERIHVMGNGVDLDYFEADGSYFNPFANGRQVAVFTGAMDYWPNVQAVTWFAEEVLPLVKKRWPKFEFWIVGRNPPREVRRMAQEYRIQVTGTVEDIRPYIAHASVIVAPLQIGRGVQNKVLEAMAMAKTVVASPLACEGIRVTNQKEILIAATREEFATAIHSVLSATSRPIGHRARSKIERDFRWNFAVLDKLLDKSETVAAAVS